MRIGTFVAALVVALFVSGQASAQTFPPQGEFYHQYDDGRSTTCPGGFMTGIGARTGAWFNAIYALCATYDSSSHQLQPAAPGVIVGYYGSSAGALHEKRCPANQAIEYIAFSEFEVRDNSLGILGDPFTMLDEIVFRCRTITTQGESVGDPVIGMTSSDALEIADMNTTHPYPSGPNVNPGFTHKERCVDGRLATGLAVAAAGSFDLPVKYNIDGIHGIGLQCAVQPPAPTPFGGSGPASAPPPEPTGPIAVGGGASFPLGPQGGGAQHDVVCATGEALVGLLGSGNLAGLTVQCARFASRAWSGAPRQEGTLGAGGGSGAVATCSRPDPVIALDGDVSSYGGIARLRLRCPGELTAYIGRNSPNSLENWSHATITCGPGNVATGIYGWTDASGAVKSFGLHCLAASAFPGAGSAAGGSGAGAGSGSSGSGMASLGDFAGTWHVTVNNGYSYTMALFVSGGVIRGNYDTGRANGQVNNGIVSGGTLTMDLSQSSVVVGSGKGRFHFDDPLHVSGTWSIGPFSGTWSATR